jgi:hypothetical protein
MGAYENPIAVINTESDKIFANAISNVGIGVSNMLEQEKKRQSEAQKQNREWLDKTFKYITSETEGIIDQLQKVGVNNAEAFNAVGEVMNEGTGYGLAALRASTVEEQRKLLAEAAKLKGAAGAFIGIQKGLKANDELFNKEFIENIDKAGKEGGVPLVGKKNQMYNLGMSIRSGINPGNEKFYFNKEKGNWRVKYTGPEITKAGLNEIDMDAAFFAAYDPGIIPEISKEIFTLFSEKSENNPRGLGFLDKSGQLSSQYVDTGNIKYEISKKDGIEFRTEIFPAKVGEMTAQATTYLTAQAEGLLKSGTQAEVVWENILSSEDNPLEYGASGNGIFTKDSEEKFIKAYVAKGLESIPKYKVGKTEAVDLAERARKEAKEDKPTKLTVEDKKVIDVTQKLNKANEVLKWNGIDDFSSPISKSLAKIDFESKIGDELGLTAKPLNQKDPKTNENIQVGWSVYNPDLKSYEQEILFEETIPQINKKILRAIGKGWSGLQSATPPPPGSNPYSNIQGVTVNQ